MSLEAQYLESIPQTKYLSVDNCVNYRAIMRIFYQEHQKMHYQLDKQTIMAELRQDRLFFFLYRSAIDAGAGSVDSMEEFDCNPGSP